MPTALEDIDEVDSRYGPATTGATDAVLGGSPGSGFFFGEITYPEAAKIPLRTFVLKGAPHRVEPVIYFRRARFGREEIDRGLFGIGSIHHRIEEAPRQAGAVIYFPRAPLERFSFTTATLEPAPEQSEEETAVGPIEELDELLDEESKVRELIAHVRTSPNIHFAEKLGNRLEALLEVVKEESPDKLVFSSDSLRNFVTFLQSQSHLKYPDVVISPSGNIRAQWSTAHNRHFAAEFFPNEDVRFVIFAPRPDRTLRLSGIASVNTLMETVEPHGVLNWASDRS
jgi:hypothetical protein